MPCYKQIPFVDFASLIGKDIELRHIYVSANEDKQYVGIDETVTVTVKRFDVSDNPAYLTYHYVRDDGVSHECSSPADLFIQYDDNALRPMSGRPARHYQWRQRAEQYANRCQTPGGRILPP